ncbi:zinc finger protein 385D-like isoform X1 [Corythoichthys intestinalis]|uniref:zinc finger protein 385D-like isoform X1 n=2 Tax=Corythoichthys intestinalis TaxID=161448 RepID=UPI0025A57440|nr:zinc finger protein 385D-like isoform X1 [Corythoichthys intestinalis]XP_057681996.1 zinc finger protein 385D-like isoform X1 [Corythoichthys intestinalis]
MAPRAKRERRQGTASATVCQVCNIRLNSGAQAQIHYKGKTHQRRLRRLAKVGGTGAMSQNQVHPLLGSLPVPLSGRASLQPHNHLEHFLPLRISASSPLSLFPNFNTMDPVQKAVINHTFGIAPPKRRTTITCNICHLRFNSTNQAEAHYKGHKHTRKLKALENQRNRQKNKPSQPASEREEGTAETDLNSNDITDLSTSSQLEMGLENSLTPNPCTTDSTSSHSPQLSQQFPHDPPLSHLTAEGTPAEGDSPGPPAVREEEDDEVKVEEKETNKKCLHCPTCKVTVNSSSQLEAHCSGSKHKQMLHSPNSSQSHRRKKRTSSPRRPCRLIKQRVGTNKTREVVGVTGQRFHCHLCQVAVNSESQLKQHMNSRRHKEHLAGKPVKAKFTPYNKLPSSSALATKLAFQKQLCKALPAGFLTNGLNPAALCTLASAPLALRLPHGPTAIIHSPLISPALFRPAPGPLRATHPPIIFSPY